MKYGGGPWFDMMDKKLGKLVLKMVLKMVLKTVLKMVVKMVVKMVLNSSVVKMIMLNHALPRWWLAAREGGDPVRVC